MGFLALMFLFLLEQLGDEHLSIFQANENSSPSGKLHFKWNKNLYSQSRPVAIFFFP
ncbi:hypothetical protein HMPREF9397_1230 [Streptococcus sanguinis SK1087]|uniref:Uncharacterized protein n=1 Tax=Streptococcus sanguinis SK1087 TaxID=888824 RepID=F3SJA8_STRSA|nr:hypothetical protein HMPREF9397_1230 [Streptococcus sanguinis SK1087]